MSSKGKIQPDDLQYLKSIGAPELFDKLVSQLLKEKPSDVRQFLLTQLLTMKENGQKVTELEEEAVKALGAGLDLTDEPADDQIEKWADRFLHLYPTLAELKAVESSLIPRQDKQAIIFLLALKCAISKHLVDQLPSAVHFTFVVAMYKENNRMQRREEHEAGENFIRRKVRQMQWLAKGKQDFSWDLLYVDDGCPNASGKAAAELIQKENIPNSRVIYLEDGIKAGIDILHGLKETSDSQKGGAIQYGLHIAAQNQPPGKAVVVGYTDSDLSADLKQSGLLISPIVNGDAVCTLGSRYEGGGVYCSAHKPEGAFSLQSRSAANLTFRNFLRKKILPPLANVFDTQCGFKAFAAEKIPDILPQVKDKKASFDMELLVVAAQVGGKALYVVPVVWVESLAESNFWQNTSSVYENYFKMNQRMMELHNNHKDLFTDAQMRESKEFMEFISAIDLRTFEKLMQAVTATVDGSTNLFEASWTVDQLKGFVA
eukprot:NODE_899_length_1567_cov_88.669444_g888_i0.p1 GENE.NODE_899_length_1567_cov_88.669444_g888_i0~~NODE_899_length_1567_cov_88.669444_g888_i0.p1  ORF type:complete len:507 (+),score=147.13 NODE_899_length_1567_cov_88.669444_g888_i0:63-1523(+)